MGAGSVGSGELFEIAGLGKGWVEIAFGLAQCFEVQSCPFQGSCSFQA